MEFRVLPKPNTNPVIKVSSENFKNVLIDFLESKPVLHATVLSHSAGNKNYLLNFSGKQIQMSSEAKLLIGERLELRIHKQGNGFELEILTRSTNTKNVELDQNGWSKSYFSPMKAIYKAAESMQSEISVQKIFQFLDVYFPGMDWNRETSVFDWTFEGGEASGFYGQKDDSFSFYFHVESKNLGEINSYFRWKKDDFSDFVLHSVFDSFSVYLIANEKLPELKKMLSSNFIVANDIIFHYSTVYNEKGDWIA